MTRASRVDDRMDEFVLAWQEGEVDPREYFSGLDDRERQEMEMRIELFLERAGPDQWDASLYRGSLSEQVVEGVLGEAGEPGGETLIAIRVECGLGKREVAAGLAEDLGATSGTDRRRISDYYHRLEWGTLDPSAISRRVIDSIASILGTDRETVSDAIPKIGTHQHEVFARYSAEPLTGETVGADDPAGEQPLSDWIDDLFINADRDSE